MRRQAMRRSPVLMLIALLFFGLVAGCGSSKDASQSATSSASTRTVTDQAGVKVTLPTNVQRVADLWHANNQVVLMLGGADRLVATTDTIKNMKWFATVDPGIAKVTAPFNGNDLQVEELVKLHPDVVLSSTDAQIEAARNAGLAAVKVNFQNFQGLRDTVNLTAQVLGGDAPARAKQYLAYLDKNIAYVSDRITDVPESQRPTVLHIANPSDLLTVDGTNSMIDEWIKLSGGRNALSVQGNLQQVTMETIVKSDPDNIIIGSMSTEDALKKLQSDPAFSQLRAVKEGHVYGNPRGTFPWDRYSAEEALQVLWAAKLLHPDKFADLDLVKQTQDFYKTFMNYDLSQDQAKLILAGKDPA